MQDLNDLYYFVQVVEHGGFAKAGRAIGVPKSKLSRRIAALEEQLGVRLLQRTTRKLAVTEIGQEYYRHGVAMLIEANAAQEAIDRSRSKPQGLIRVSAPPALVCFEIGPMIARYMAANPDGPEMSPLSPRFRTYPACRTESSLETSDAFGFATVSRQKQKL